MQFATLLRVVVGLAAVVLGKSVNQIEERQVSNTLTVVIVSTTSSPVAIVTAVVRSTVTDVIVSVPNTAIDSSIISVATNVATYYTASLVPVFTPQTSAIAVTSLETFVALPSLTTSIGSVAVATNIIYSPITSVFATNSFRFNTPTSLAAGVTTIVGAGATTTIFNAGAATTAVNTATGTTAVNAATGTTAVNVAAAPTYATGGASAGSVARASILPHMVAAAVAVITGIFALL